MLSNLISFKIEDLIYQPIKYQLVIVLLGGIGLYTIAELFLLHPQREHLNRLQQQQQHTDSQIKTQQLKLSSKGTLEYQSLQDAYAQALQYLPSRASLANIFTEINQQAFTNHVTPIHLAWGQKQIDEFRQRLPIHIQLEGSFNHLINFLYQLTQQDYVIDIQFMYWQFRHQLNPSQTKQPLKLDIQALIYLRNEQDDLIAAKVSDLKHDLSDNKVLSHQPDKSQFLSDYSMTLQSLESPFLDSLLVSDRQLETHDVTNIFVDDFSVNEAIHEIDENQLTRDKLQSRKIKIKPKPFNTRLLAAPLCSHIKNSNSAYSNNYSSDSNSSNNSHLGDVHFNHVDNLVRKLQLLLPQQVLNPLQQWPLNELQFVGSVKKLQQRIGIIQDGNMQLWNVEVGDVIGRNDGVILNITAQEVIVMQLELINDCLQPKQIRLTL